MKQSVIGNVKIFTDVKTLENVYRDPTDNFILEFFDKPQSQKQSQLDALLLKDSSWPIQSNLSSNREFLLEWYPFLADQTILEIGAGCGALTGLFCRKLKKVYANELNSVRAEAIAKRYSDQLNIEVHACNLSSMQLSEPVDIISVVGVLEYAGAFLQIEKNDEWYESPFLTFLSQLKTLLKPKGHLLLAIENQLGLKYLVGGKEDHYNTLFSSIENYPNYTGVRTFTKTALKTLLAQAGFSKSYFYYPYPDYKMPHTILSEETFKYKLNVSLSSYTSIIDYSNERIPLINETTFARLLQSEQIFDRFANSFLVDAEL